MRALLLLALSAALVLPGCVDQPAALDEQSAAGVVPVVPNLLVYDANGTAVAPPAEFLNGTTRVAQYLLGTRGAEPNVGVTSSGAIFVSSGDYVQRSTDNGRTWEIVYEFGPEVAGNDVVFNNDPFLYVDPLTDRVFAPFMFPILTCANAAWSDDDGETWIEKPMACGLPVVDHQKVAAGPYAASTPKPPVTPYENVVYFCYNKLESTNCAVSFDGGLQYPLDVPVAIASRDGCAGVNGNPRAAPDGTVYVALGNLLGSCDDLVLGVSTDNGRSWTLKRPDVGGLGQEEIDPMFTVTPDGTAYLTWRAIKDHQVYYIRSTDRFDTIEGPFKVNPPNITSTRFPVITSGDDGRIAISYLGTDDTDKRPMEAPDETRWHLYVTFILNAAEANPVFTTVQVTPEEDPVQIGYMWEGGGGDPARNLLDFNDMRTGPDGRVVVAFTDGCVDGCAGKPDATPDDSRARMTAVAVLEEGPSLYATKGHLSEA